MQLRKLIDLEEVDDELAHLLLQLLVQMTGEASQEGVVDGLRLRIVESDCTLDEEESPAEVPQADVAAAHLLEHQCPHLCVEGEQLALVGLVETADIWIVQVPRVALDDVPQIVLIFKLTDVYFREF